MITVGVEVLKSSDVESRAYRLSDTMYDVPYRIAGSEDDYPLYWTDAYETRGYW